MKHAPHGELPPDWRPRATALDAHRYSLTCDVKGCAERSPESDAVYFETGGEKMARAIAEQNGWVRVGQRDLCPGHAELAAHGKGGKQWPEWADR